MASNIYGAIALGSGTGGLKAIDGTALADNDIAVVVVQGVGSYLYALDADSAATEESPNIIEPTANGGDKRWILQSVNGMALVPHDVSGTPTTLLFSQCAGYIHYVTNAGATTVVLPAVSTVPTGAMMVLYMTTAYVLTIDPNAADRIRLNGVALADGLTIVSGGEVGNYVSLQKDGTDGWTVVGRSGYWAGGA